MSKEHLMWLQKYIKEVYQTPIMENFLNLKIVEIAEGKVTFSAKIVDRHCNMYGFVHGGTLASIADAVMGTSCTTFGKRIVTTDMSISYIKNVTSGSTLTAVGKVISNGRTMMRTTAQIYDEKKELLVSVQGSYFVIGDFHQDDYPQLK